MLSTPYKLRIYCHSTFLPVLPPTPPHPPPPTRKPTPAPLLLHLRFHLSPWMNHRSITALVGASEAAFTKQAAIRCVSDVRRVRPQSRRQRTGGKPHLSDVAFSNDLTTREQQSWKGISPPCPNPFSQKLTAY